MTNEFNDFGITITLEQENLFKKYYNFLVEENSKYNLTTIIEYQDVIIKHFIDSLASSAYFDYNLITTLADIGTGAGFPGIPLKIMFPHLKLTLIESNSKKCKFLIKLVQLLSLENVDIMTVRAEDTKKGHLSFDCITCRAVSDIKTILDYSFHLLKPKGYYVLLKGEKAKEELLSLKTSHYNKKVIINKVDEFDLPNEKGHRSIIQLKKM
jgi:16S rRNA (guanine527-N7)-methyltransferase